MRWILVLLVAAGLAHAEEWWVVLPREPAAVAVRDDGKAMRKRPAVHHPPGRRAPDGQRRAYLDDGLFVVGRRAGARRVEGVYAMSSQPAWSPDGARLLFTRKDGRTWQVKSVRPDGEDARHVRDLPAKARRPKLSPDARHVAYHVERAGWGKGTLDDFFVMDLTTGANQRLVERKYIADHAWSDDGKRLAVATQEALLLFEMPTGKLLRTVTHASIDPRLHAHAAKFLLWRPDGKALACQMMFLGGRFLIEGEDPEPLFGDHELFIVPVEGKVKVISVPRDVWVKPVAWKRDDG